MAQRIPCFICPQSLIPRVMVRIFGEENNVKCDIAITRRDEAGRPALGITPDTRICNNCNISITQEIHILQNDPNSMRLNVLSQTSSKTCLICNCQNDTHRLTSECRAYIFIKKNIYIPMRYVSCYNHLDERGFLKDENLDQLRYINRPYSLNGNELQVFLQSLRQTALNTEKGKYENELSISEEDFISITGINKLQFNELFAYCDPVPVPGGHRYVNKKDLICFLCKMRQGVSDDFLHVMFNYSSRQATSMAIANVRQTLSGRFVNENIGFGCITRQEFMDNHVTDFSNRLYNPEPNERKAIVYIDCTYLDIEKSMCFKALRQSFCVHKKRHLVKPSIIVGPNGYILDIQGPYFSNAANNDARIVLNEFHRDVDGMQNWFDRQDIFILDRGYRDAIPHLQRMGVFTIMPPLLENAAQFETADANRARLITKTRWIIEARNGHLKSLFKFFANLISTSHVSNLNDFLRIAGAIINKYHGPILMADADEHMAEQMLLQAQERNAVQDRVNNENLRNRRAHWVTLNDAHIPLFPQLTMQYLKELTFGTYQLHLAPSYIQDTLLRNDEDIYDDEEQMIDLDLNTNEPGFFRARIFSRFSNAKSHQVWIHYNEEYVENNGHGNDEPEPIIGYYCTCKVGTRTLGTCAHVACIIWYLGYARHTENVRYPSLQILRNILNSELDLNNIEIIDP